MGIISKEWIVNQMITLVGKGPLEKIKKSTLDPEKAQRKFLAKLIKDNKNTAFGKEHKFSTIKNYKDFVKQVPIRTYDQFEPYIQRLQKGEENVLFSGRPAMYNTSSGTTAKPKLIPISERYKKDLADYNKLWLYSILEQNPGIYKGKSLTSVGKAIEDYVEDGTPIGSISGNSFRTIPKAISLTNSSVYALFALDDYDMRYYAIARNALEHNITVSICPSIANIIRYHETIMENFDQMVAEIREGKIRADISDALLPDDRAEVLGRVHPNPKRADELVALKAKYGRALLPKHYWPNLVVINAWVQGNFAILVKKLKEYFPVTTVIRAFGYQASEGRFGMSLDNHWEYSVLIPTHYFYEFIAIEDIEQENPKTLMYHELELDKRYYIIISNISGLYRYDMNDILEVVGFHNKTPLLRFVQKGAGIVNIMGEKLAEEQVIDATFKTAGETMLTVNNFLMFGDRKAFKYEYFVEFEEEVCAEQKREFITKLDETLQKNNMEYKSKRESKRLSLPDLILLPKGSHQIIKETLVRKQLAKDGQYKDLYLTAKEKTREALKDLF